MKYCQDALNFIIPAAESAVLEGTGAAEPPLPRDPSTAWRGAGSRRRGFEQISHFW